MTLLSEEAKSARKPLVITLLLMLIGIPLTWVVKEFFMKCFVTCFGTECDERKAKIEELEQDKMLQVME